MKRLLIFFFFVALSNHLQSQVIGRLFYDNQWRLTRKDSSIYFRTSIIDTTNRVFAGEVRDYTKEGKILMKGNYKNGKKDGLFTFYYPNGKVESEGTFIADYRVATWKYYYSDGKVKQEVKFPEYGNAQIMLYNFPDGNPSVKKGTGFWREEYYDPGIKQVLINEGNLKANLKDGIWMCKTLDGIKIFEQHFKRGQFLRRIDFDDDGRRLTEVQEQILNTLMPHYKLEITEQFTLADESYRSLYPFLKIKSIFDEWQQEQSQEQHPRDSSVFVKVDVPPAPACGMDKFYQGISKIIRYPAQARRFQIEGSVYVNFIVKVDSSVAEMKVIKGIGAGCDEEALRVVGEVHKLCGWVPGSLSGKTVAVRMTVPIKFRLDVVRYRGR